MEKIKNLIIGLVGLPGSGKTTVAKILEKKGFKIITLSSFIKEELEKKGLEIDRKSLQDMGDKIRENKRADILAKMALRKIKKHKIKKAIIDGIRNLSEIKRLEKEDNLYLIGLSATPDKRFSRLIKSTDKYNSIKTWDDFVYYQLREDRGVKKETGQQNRLCYFQAKYFIDNNSGFKSLENKIKKILTKIAK